MRRQSAVISKFRHCPPAGRNSPCGYRADMTIRVLIADDHGVVAEGLRNLIEAQTDMKVVALVEDGREAVRRALESSPDVVIMPTAYTDAVHVYRALQAGASGYIAKKSVTKEVVDAIRKAHEERQHLSGQLTESLIDHVVHKAASDEPL